MSDFLKTDLERHREEIRQQLAECHDPHQYKLLMAEFQQTMSAIVDGKQDIDPTEEIQARRANGEVGTADAMEQALAVSAAQSHLREAQDRFDSSSGSASAEKALRSAEEALERAQAPTPMRVAEQERDRLYRESNELAEQAVGLCNSLVGDERLKGDQMKQEAKDLMQKFYETRVEV